MFTSIDTYLTMAAIIPLYRWSQELLIKAHTNSSQLEPRSLYII